MKSYTDIEQSKKLAEILPLESADMFYTSLNSDYPWIWIDKYSMEAEDIPCWSLAALLSVLPYGYSSILTKSFDGKDYYCKIDGKTFETEADNPVDACVAMILKLHELNLL
jgi:hypothetical protein